MSSDAAENRSVGAPSGRLGRFRGLGRSPARAVQIDAGVRAVAGSNPVSPSQHHSDCRVPVPFDASSRPPNDVRAENVRPRTAHAARSGADRLLKVKLWNVGSERGSVEVGRFDAADAGLSASEILGGEPEDGVQGVGRVAKHTGDAFFGCAVERKARQAPCVYLAA